jgi:hypothetical protein
LLSEIQRCKNNVILIEISVVAEEVDALGRYEADRLFLDCHKALTVRTALA